MPDKKLTDEQIIKALEHCSYNDVKRCDDCSYYEKETKTYCVNELIKDVLDLINRQKAEIERLNTMHSEMCIGMKVLKKTAIKEYREKVKSILMDKGIYPAVVKNALNEAEKILLEENLL